MFCLEYMYYHIYIYLKQFILYPCIVRKFTLYICTYVINLIKAMYIYVYQTHDLADFTETF